jgi:hypothetical protein
MSFPFSSPSWREEYKGFYHEIGNAFAGTRERTNPNLHKIRSGVFVNIEL